MSKPPKKKQTNKANQNLFQKSVRRKKTRKDRRKREVKSKQVQQDGPFACKSSGSVEPSSMLSLISRLGPRLRTSTRSSLSIYLFERGRYTPSCQERLLGPFRKRQYVSVLGELGGFQASSLCRRGLCLLGLDLTCPCVVLCPRRFLQQ